MKNDIKSLKQENEELKSVILDLLFLITEKDSLEIIRENTKDNKFILLDSVIKEAKKLVGADLDLND